MIKLVLSDLDGTLLNQDYVATKEDQEAVLELQAKGVTFALATGRDIGFCNHLLDTYGFGECDIIANNGGSLWIGQNKIAEEHIEAKEVLRIMEFLLPHLHILNPFICNEERTFYFLKDHYADATIWEAAHKKLAYLGTISDEDLLDYLKRTADPAVKISIETGDEETMRYFLPILTEQFKEYEVLPTASNYIELTRKGIHKGATLSLLMKQLDLQPHEVAVFGDGLNDVSMFGYVSHSYAMAHADEEVRNKAGNVVKNVAEAIHSVIQYNVAQEK